MLNKITLQNFRGFEDLTIDDFQQINLLVGKNSSGKTSVLEAIFLALNPYGNSIAELVECRGAPIGILFDIRTLQPSKTPDWEYAFWLLRNFGQNAAQNSVIEITNSALTRKLLIKPYLHSEEYLKPTKQAYDYLAEQANHTPADSDFVYLATHDRVGQDDFYFASGVKRDDTKPNKIISAEYRLFDSVAQKYLQEQAKKYSPPKVFYYHASTNYGGTFLPKHLEEVIYDAENWPEVMNIVKSINPAISEIGFGFDGRVVVHLKNTAKPMPLALAGDGIKKILSILCSVKFCRDGVLLIDEIENGLHYEAQLNFMKALRLFAKKFAVQVFATTHSYELIQCADKTANLMGSIDDTALYRMPGKRLVRYEQAGIRAAIEEEMEVR